MKKIKKFVAVILLSLTLFNTTFNSYVMTVQATEVLTMTVVDALLAMFGLELGLGNQTDFFCNSEFTDFVDAVADGRTVNMPIYGDVNFSDGESILSWLSWAQNAHNKVDGNNVVDIAFDTAIITLSKALDKTSYSSTGSSATNVMRNRIDILKDYYNTATDFVGEVKEAFSSMNGTGDGKMTRTRWDIITGMFSTFMYGTANKISGFIDSLKSPQKTVYTEYSDFYETGGYDPNRVFMRYNNLLDPELDDYRDYCVAGSFIASDGDSATILLHESYFDDLSWFYYGVLDSEGNVDYKQVNTNTRSVYELPLYCASYDVENDKFYHLYYTANNWSYDRAKDFFYPIFEKDSDALAYSKNGATVPILNAVDGLIYPTFKEQVGINTLDISDMIKQLIDTVPAVDDIAKVIPEALDKTKEVAGTQNAILSITTAIADVAGIIQDNQEQDNENAQSILSAIGAIALNWKNLFKWLDDFWTWLKNAWIELVNAIGVGAVAGHPNGPVDSDDSSSSSGFINLLNGLIMLISIFFILLRIFLHLLEFIINIFRIPADPGFITGDFAIGFEYIKSVQLTPLNISVYDFLMGLVHILVLFSVVKVLKKHIDRIHL